MAAEERVEYFKKWRFREGRGAYRLLEDFGVVRNENLSERCELEVFLVLDIDRWQGLPSVCEGKS
jgi:hypothetical protein